MFRSHRMHKDKRAMNANIRRATIVENNAIALIHRLSRDVSLPFLSAKHTFEEDCVFFRTRVFPMCEVWVMETDEIFGFIAFHEGWVDHLYIHPREQRRGLGRTLLQIAKERFSGLQLWTFQKNLGARRFYEGQGFRLVTETDGSANDEGEPDALYRWSL